MKKLPVICLLPICLFAIVTAYADDSAFGGTGASPIPIKQTAVRMVNEHIVLYGVGIYQPNLGGAWKVSCLFTFQNMLNKTLRFRMGFPFPVRDKFGEVAIPAGYKVKVDGPLVYGFSVQVDKKPIAFKRYKISPNPKHGLYYQNAYIWDMLFKPKQIVKIQHQYLMGINGNALGQTIVSYILKTGGLWYEGRIGRVRLEVIPNVPTRLCREVKTSAMLHIPSSLQGVKIIGTGSKRKYVWDLHNFKPTQDLDLCLQTGRDYVRYRFIYPLISNELNLNKMSAEQLRILRNTIYAQYGRTFKDAKLQAYFDKQWWYMRDPHYTNTMLNQSDYSAINMINKKLSIN